jgi:hypothetical protein
MKGHHILNPLLILFALVLCRLGLTLKIKDFLLLLGSLIFTIGLLETGLHLWNAPITKPHLLQVHRPSPLLGWELVPASQGVGLLGETYTINSAGFRDRECLKDKPASVFRIAVIGDSFTFGQGVNLEQTLVKQMEEFLRSRGIASEVLNFGVIGYNMWQYNVVLEKKALLYQPDLVVLCLFQDDLGRSKPPYKDTPEWQAANPFEAKGSSGVIARIAFWNLLRNASLLFEYKYRYRHGHSYVKDIEERKRVWGPANPTDANYRIMTGKLEKKKRDEFSTALGQFASYVHRAGAEVLVAVVPDSVQLNDPAMQGSTRFIREVCESLGVPFIDLTPFLETEPNPSSLYLFPIDAHNSPKGLKVIGEVLGERLLELGLLTPG